MEVLFGRMIVLVSFLLIQSVVSIEFSRRQYLGGATESGLNHELSWGFNDTHIELQISYPSLGWLAIGLSPDGGMDKSDVLWGYVNDTNGEVVIQDRYLIANMDTFKVTLTLDADQNWQTVSGSKNSTHTTLRAVRKIKTCDQNDRPFTADDQPVIFSCNFKLPESPNGPIRKHNVRGQTTIKFLETTPKPDPDISGEITQTLEFRMANRTIPGDEDTHYFCQLAKLPTFDKKYQSIASQPIINAQNIKQIHHMLFYMCANLPEADSQVEFFECGPRSNSFVMKECQGLLGGWAMGVKPTNFQPAEAGQPFTPEMSGGHVVLQIHYNNPDHLTFVDDSGIRFLLTDKLRKYDSGAIMVGIMSLDWTLTLPPGLDNFHVQGQCSDQCTAPQIPPEGINIYQTTVHMHTRGKSGVGRHFRGSQEILPPLGSILSYDFNFQHAVPLTEFRKFLPGDRIIMECNFTTANDTMPVYGGEGSMEEMCMIFVAYYPKTNLQMCGSIFRIEPYLRALGLHSDQLMKDGNFPKMRSEIATKLLSKETGNMKQLLLDTLKDPVTKFITREKWTPTNSQALEDYYTGMNYIGICAVNGKFVMVPDDRPPNITFYVDPAKQGC